jgi:hypothetical protein
MEIGESVNVAVALASEDKCVICSKKHAKSPRKEEDVQPVASAQPASKWGRVSMSGVFLWVSPRREIYKGGTTPGYATQGHHCVALSALVTDANTAKRRDRRIRLNHFLHKVGFYPNRDRNCILLPARRGFGDFDAFWHALDDDKPLQMHGPGHDESYFTQCDRLLSVMVMLVTDPGDCEEQSKEDWESSLRRLVEQAESYAFRKLAGNDGAWRLHPAEQETALKVYFSPRAESFQVRTIGGNTKRVDGLGNDRRDVHFPAPALDTGPF